MFTVNLNGMVVEPRRISMNDICWHYGKAVSIFDWDNVYSKNSLYETFLGTNKGEWWGSLRYWPIFKDEVIGGKPTNARTAFLSMVQGHWYKHDGDGYEYKGHIYDEYWSSSLMFPTMIGVFDGFIIKPSSAKFSQEFIWLETNQVSDLLAENAPSKMGNQIVILKDSKEKRFDAFFSYYLADEFIKAWNKKRKALIALIDEDKENFEKVCREDELLRDERKRRKEVTEELIRRRMKIELETFKNPPEFCLDSRIEAAVHEAGFEMPSCW